jgi:hypothetical protein
MSRLLIVSPLAGFVSRSWVALAFPLAAIPLYVVGKHEDWWGCCGTGDSWRAGMVVLTLFAGATTAAGIALGPHPWRFQLSCSASPMMMPSGPRRKQSR